MRYKLNFYLMLAVFCVSHFLPGQNNFCFAQSLRLENAEKKDSRSNPINTAPEQTKEDDVIRVETNLIVNEILVFDKNGNPVRDLNMNDFSVAEDGRRQEISAFSFGDNEAFPRSIVLIIDYSGSQLPYIKTSIEAAKVLVDKLHPQDRMAIVTDNVELIQDFTTDKSLLKEKLESLKTSALSEIFGISRQYSALMAVLTEMFTERDFRPIIIFQTDGDEPLKLKNFPLGNSAGKNGIARFSFDDVLTATEKTRATIYSIIPGIRFFGIPENECFERSRMATIDVMQALSSQREKLSSPENLNFSPKFLKFRADLYRRQQSALYRIAQNTGGSTNFLERPEQADRVYSEVLSKMNLRYLIGYYPTNQTRDGRRREVSIKLRRHPDYKIWSRKTYILGEK